MEAVGDSSHSIARQAWSACSAARALLLRNDEPDLLPYAIRSFCPVGPERAVGFTRPDKRSTPQGWKTLISTPAKFSAFVEIERSSQSSTFVPSSTTWGAGIRKLSGARTALRVMKA